MTGTPISTTTLYTPHISPGTFEMFFFAISLWFLKVPYSLHIAITEHKHNHTNLLLIRVGLKHYSQNPRPELADRPSYSPERED